MVDEIVIIITISLIILYLIKIRYIQDIFRFYGIKKKEHNSVISVIPTTTQRKDIIYGETTKYLFKSPSKTEAQSIKFRIENERFHRSIIEAIKLNSQILDTNGHIMNFALNTSFNSEMVKMMSLSNSYNKLPLEIVILIYRIKNYIFSHRSNNFINGEKRSE